MMKIIPKAFLRLGSDIGRPGEPVDVDDLMAMRILGVGLADEYRTATKRPRRAAKKKEASKLADD